MKLCKDCKHYNDGDGDAVCMFCDPTFEDRWDGITNEESDESEEYNVE